MASFFFPTNFDPKKNYYFILFYFLLKNKKFTEGGIKSTTSLPQYLSSVNILILSKPTLSFIIIIIIINF